MYYNTGTQAKNGGLIAMSEFNKFEDENMEAKNTNDNSGLAPDNEVINAGNNGRVENVEEKERQVI